MNINKKTKYQIEKDVKIFLNRPKIEDRGTEILQKFRKPRTKTENNFSEILSRMAGSSGDVALIGAKKNTANKIVIITG